MKTYTVVAEYLDNQQTYVTSVRAEDVAAAAQQARQQCRLDNGEPLDDSWTSYEVRIRSIFEGAHEDLWYEFEDGFA